MSETLRYLALGDSYTIGEGVAPEDRWPHQLVARLRADGVAIGEPEIIAATGWTTDELNAGIDAADPQGPYDLVSLLVGVNNQYRGRDLEEYRTQFRGLLNRAIGFAEERVKRVVVVSIPDWGVTPFAAGRDRQAITEAINVFNAVAQEETERAGTAWVDIAPLSRTQGAAVGADGLHPDGEAYTGWTALIFPAVRAMLRN
ncbi:MAG: SGNH/GDSL hydrolase family protein [Rhodothermaceae bacterium]|nr:SGNH/GDSL hydrolase family protein [Rhodothermaceae bacterium]